MIVKKLLISRSLDMEYDKEIVTCDRKSVLLITHENDR